MVLTMNDLEDLRRRMRITNLEARLDLHEIEIAAFDRELASALTSRDRKAEATERRDALLRERCEIKTELDQMRRSFPHLAQH